MSNLQNIPKIDSVALSSLIEKYDGALKSALADGKALKLRVDTAKSAYGAIDDDLDTEINDYLVNLKVTVERMYNGRLPYTKVFDEIKSIFTGFESLISPKQKEGIFIDFQKERDTYARKKKADDDAKARINAEKLDKDKERASLKAICETSIRTAAETIIAQYKSNTTHILETANLQTIDSVDDTASSLLPDSINIGTINNQLASMSRYHNADERLTICNEVYSLGLQSEIAQNIHMKIAEHLDSIRERIPGKQRELEKIAQAGEDEKVRLQELADQRAKDAQAKINFDMQNASSDIASDVEAKKEAEIANVTFEADTATTVQRGVRKACTIRVTNVKGYLQIINFWFKYKGITLTPEEMDKVKVESMRKFMEKHYLDSGVKIDSPDLIYEEDIKTSVRK